MNKYDKIKVIILAQILLAFCYFNIAVAAPVLTGTSEGMQYEVHQVTDGLGIPWGLSFLDTEWFLVTEREGSLKMVNSRTGAKKEISGLPGIWSKEQGGLLDVAVSPLYSEDKFIYFTYSKNVTGGSATTLARAKLSGDSLTEWQDILITDSAGTSGRHFGSRITFDNDGFLYFSVGDRGIRKNGQDTTNHAGTIIRLHLDGEVPADNPFIEKEGRKEIWSYGHRNPQGIVFDKKTNILWSNEHGPRGGDEVNMIVKGANYGWAVVSHGKEYWGPFDVGEATSKPGMEDPVKIYTPSIAPSSLILYSGKVFPAWKDNFFAGALALTHLNRVPLDGIKKGEEERMLLELDERIRAVTESPDGLIYFSTDSGKILRIQPAAK